MGRQDNSNCFLNQGNAAVQGLGNAVPACWVTGLMETLLHNSVGGMWTDSDVTGDNRPCQLCLQIISRKDAHPRPSAHGHLQGKVRSHSTTAPAVSAIMSRWNRAASPLSPPCTPAFRISTALEWEN